MNYAMLFAFLLGVLMVAVGLRGLLVVPVTTTPKRNDSDYMDAIRNAVLNHPLPEVRDAMEQTTPATHFDLTPATGTFGSVVEENLNIPVYLWLVVDEMHPEGMITELEFGPENIKEWEEPNSARIFIGML